MRKRILSLVLCLTVMLSGMTPIFAVEEQVLEVPEQSMQAENPEPEQLPAEETESIETQGAEITEPEPKPVEETESADAERLKNVQTATEVYVNPLYEDVQSEADLKKPEDGISALAEEEYTSDESVLAANIRNGMENREETITLYYASEQEYDSTWLKQWVNLAFEETDVPTQGDYIRWVWGGYKASVSYYQSNGTYYYTYTMTVTYYTTAEQETQVTEKVDELLDGFAFTSETPDYTKIKTIYDYICENVTYDYDNLEDEDYKLKYTAYAALIDGTAVCQGYAVLLYRMLEEVDVDTRVISGIGNGGAHGWNITQLRGKYYDLDSTWDAGRSSYRYFLKCDANFGDHTRDENYSSSEFYEAYPMDTADYVVQDGDLPAETNIVASGTCGENLTWTLDDAGTLTISGTGEMTDYNYGSDAPWYRHLASIKTIVIDDGVTGIGDYAFDNSDNAFDDISSLTSVTIGNSVTSIGTGAFMWCAKLTDVTMGNSVTSFERNAFYHCNNLTSVEIPDSTVSIGRDAFSYCKSLTSVAIPESVTSIGATPFEACIGLTSITVEQGNPNYCSDNGVLYDKAQTALIQYPAGKTDTSFVIPNSVTSIDEGAFYDCDSLTSVTIPESVTSIGENAFGNDDALAEIKFNGDLPQINAEAFTNVTATAYYPSTWETVPASDEYGGDLTWVAYEVEPSLTITTQPSDYIGAVGENAIFTIEAIGDNLTYQWQYQNVGTDFWQNSSQSGNKTATLSVPITEKRNGQKYRCVVTDASGNSVTSDEATLIVEQEELQIVSQPSDYTGAVGDTATFTIEATGTGLTYQWQYQNVGTDFWQNSSQSGNKTATLSVPITEKRNGQKYRCVVTDASGNTVTSNEAVLRVDTGLAITTQPSDYTGAVGDTATFTLEAAGTGLTYQWQYQNVGTDFWQNSSQSGNKTATLSVPITEKRNGQKYRCVVTDASGNTVTSNEAVLRVDTGLAITTQPSDYTGAVGDTATFTIEATGEGLTYQWQYQNVGTDFWQNSSQSGNKTSTLNVPITEKRNGQKYRCVVTDASGNTVASDTAAIVVK